MRWIKLLVVVPVTLFAVLFWLTRPGPVDAVAWRSPAPPPLAGVLAANAELRHASLLALGLVDGPEAVILDDSGELFTGTADGRLLRIDTQGGVHPITHTGGRPLGLALDHQGRLVVADAVRGLLRVDAHGHIETLVDEIDGVALQFCDDVAIGADGVIYFTDASSRFTLPDYRLDLIEGRPHGRLLAYDPATGETRVLLGELYFANGVTLSAEGDYLLVNETFRYRIRRYWLHGERAGEQDLFAHGLPGFPDNISTRPGGEGYWVAIPSRRNPQFDRISGSVAMRNLLARLPGSLQPVPERYGMVVLLNLDGEIVAAPQDPGGELLHEITSAVEHDGHLYLGTLGGDRIGRWPIPEPLR